MTSLSDYQIKYAKYKWEFLRRNPEYINEWEALAGSNEEKYSNCLPLGWSTTDSSVTFVKKWKLTHPLNPHFTYDQMIDEMEKFLSKIATRIESENIWHDVPGNIDETGYRSLVSESMDADRACFDMLHPHYLPNHTVKPIEPWDFFYNDAGTFKVLKDSIVETGELPVKINLNYSKNRLLKEFKALIDEWKILYEDTLRKQLHKKFCKERNITSFPIDKELISEFEKIYKQELKQKKQVYEYKFHFDNYDLYLQVYDLRQEGKSWSEITSSLNLNSIQTGRNHYKAARKIIEKGIELYAK